MAAFLVFRCAILISTVANAATPDLQIVLPRGIQRGTEADIVFHGQRLADAKEILFYSPGITVTKLDATNAQQLKVHVQIAPDARIGEYPVRVRGESGISDLRTLYVGPFPIIEAKKPPGDFAHPQPIDLNVTVTGVIENEQVHSFSVEAKKGQRLTAEVHGMRLGALFDPYVAIVDEKRFELAVSDDTALAKQDPIASVIVPRDGRYIIQVRESSYSSGSHYLLHVGAFPRPRTVYPLGGQAGEELAVRFLGDVAGPIEQSLKLPSAPMPVFDLFPEQNGLTVPSPNFLRVSPFPNVLEVEPNDDVKTATLAEIELPLAFNGIIDKPGDIDYFRFKAKKGQSLHVRVIARALRSPLDSVLTLYNAQGGGIASNDDSGTPDSYIRFDPPADAEYVVSITDHLHNGGPEYTYRIEITPVKPALALSIPQYAQNSQERWTIPVPRGNRYATLVRCTRTDFGGPVAISSADLPEGMTLSADAMAPNTDVIPVVFEAKADAPIAGKLSDLTANSADPKQEAKGPYEQNVELVYGPNNQVLYQTRVEKLAAAVTKEAPFKLHLEQPKVPLVQNGSMELKVKAERSADFKGPISIRLLFTPPGLGAAAAVDMPGDKSEILYPLNASGGAPLQKWKICIVGVADVGGPLWLSSELVDLDVAPPFLNASIQMTAAEQGKPASVLCKFEQKTKFEGKAKVKLLGLPPNTTSPDVEIGPTDTQAVFPVTVDAKSPAGNHQTLFCRVTVMQNGEEIVHNVAQGGVLRIDPPAEPKKEQPTQTAAAKPAPKPAASAEKPLSRLEKLRLEAQQK